MRTKLGYLQYLALVKRKPWQKLLSTQEINLTGLTLDNFILVQVNLK